MCLHRKIDERVAADSAASLGHHDTLRRRALLRVVRDVATLRVLHAHHLDPAGFARIGGPDVYDRAYASAPDAEAPEPECSVFPS